MPVSKNPGAGPARPPQARVQRNEERILDAIVEVAGTGGWADLSVAAVSRSAGLSPKAVHDRYEDRSALAAAAWTNRCGPVLRAALAEVLSAAGALEPGSSSPARLPTVQQAAAQRHFGGTSAIPPSAEPWEKVRRAIHAAASKASDTQSGNVPALSDEQTSSVADLREATDALLSSLEVAESAAFAVRLAELRAAGPSAEWLTIALDVFARPSTAIRAATELVIASQFDPALAKAVARQLATTVQVWCTPVRKNPTPEIAAKRAYLLCLALGLVLAHVRADAAELELGDQQQSLFEALSTSRAPVALPKARAKYLDASVAFDTGDIALDSLLQATLDEVAARGFDGATTSSIARAAGCSDGLIFARYPSKLALFLDASKRQQAISFRNYDAYQTEVRTKHGMGIADAVAIREVQRPHVSAQRATYLEQIRISWHDDELQLALVAEFDQFVADATAADPAWAPANSPANLHVSIALGFGLSLLPVLHPEAWSLPYDVVTMPLAERSPAH
jgi:AcrR family transcriptional regulator